MAPYVFLLPFLIASVIFTFIPVIYSLSISFLDFTFLNPKNSAFMGIDNYKTVLGDPLFLKSLVNTLKLIIVVVPALLVISILLAVALNAKIKFRSFFRSAFYLPYVVTPVAMGVIAVQLFAKENFIVKALSAIGMDNVSWHTTAPYAFWLVVLVVVWSQMGFYMVLYLNGLQNIPAELYEAAMIDGATVKRRFWHITLPLLKPTTVLVLFMCLLSTLQILDQPYVISTTGNATPGSPGDTTLTMVMYIYNLAFRYRKMGSASAASFIVFLIIFVLSLIQNMTVGRKEE